MTGVLDDVTGREYQGVWRLWKLGSLGLFGAFVWLLADIRSIIRQHVQTEAQVSEIMLNREARRRPNETPFADGLHAARHTRRRVGRPS